MKLAILILALCTTGVAATASAAQTRRFIDADHRMPALLPADHATVITIEQAPAAPVIDAVAPGPLLQAQDGKHETAPPPAAPVPEPSGIAMLSCGLLVLLLAPVKRRYALFALGGKKARLN